MRIRHCHDLQPRILFTNTKRITNRHTYLIRTSWDLVTTESQHEIFNLSRTVLPWYMRTSQSHPPSCHGLWMLDSGFILELFKPQRT